MYVGLERMINCTWNGLETITKLDWYLRGLEEFGIGMQYGNITTMLNLGPVSSISWNGKKFVCRATTSNGSIVDKWLSLWVKGHYIILK